MDNLKSIADKVRRFSDLDLIVDRASLTHNDENSIINCIIKCHEQLVYGGKFIGIDWFSTEYSEYKKGDKTEDIWTKTMIFGGIRSLFHLNLVFLEAE